MTLAQLASIWLVSFLACCSYFGLDLYFRRRP